MDPLAPFRGFGGPFYRGRFVLLAALAAGCAPDAASTDVRGRGDLFDPDVVLAGSSAGAAVSAMQVPAAGHPTRPLEQAPDGVRWADVPMAIRNVASVTFYGVASVAEGKDGVEAVTLAGDGQRGRVRATIDAGGSVRFEVQLGTFPDAARDVAFAHALEAELRRLGTVPRPQG